MGSAPGMEHVRCPFEKAILSAQCACPLSTRKAIAERLIAGCQSPAAATRCRELLALFKERSRFTLKVTDAGQDLPFGKLMKVSVGGLLGLQLALDKDNADPGHVGNIKALIDEAEYRYGSIHALPYQEIVKSVLAYELRRRRVP